MTNYARSIAALTAMAAAVTLTSGAAAGPEAARQRVALTAKILPTGVAVLEPVGKGALARDSGPFSGTWSPTPDRTLVRDGQTVNVHTGIWTFTGNRGTLVFRERNEWVDIGNDSNRDGSDDGVAVGTWKVVRGTGKYAGIAGGGRSGHEGLGQLWYARYEGFLLAS